MAVFSLHVRVPRPWRMQWPSSSDGLTMSPRTWRVSRVAWLRSTRLEKVSSGWGYDEVGGCACDEVGGCACDEVGGCACDEVGGCAYDEVGGCACDEAGRVRMWWGEWSEDVMRWMGCACDEVGVVTMWWGGWSEDVMRCIKWGCDEVY